MVGCYSSASQTLGRRQEATAQRCTEQPSRFSARHFRPNRRFLSPPLRHPLVKLAIKVGVAGEMGGKSQQRIYAKQIFMVGSSRGAWGAG